MAGGKAKISSKSKSHPTKGKGFGNFIYDSEEGTCFGRTAASWIKIIIFYIIFYSCLAGFFCLNYYIFSKTLNEDSPKWKLDQSIIGTNPGVGFRPMPDQDANAESTLIWYQEGVDSDAKFWWSQLSTMLKHNILPEGTPGTKKCNDEGETATDSAACLVQFSETSYCTERNKYGYQPNGKPCVLIKLNKIFGWTPLPFGVNNDDKYDPVLLHTDLEDKVKNDEMPGTLRDHIWKEVNRSSNAVNTLKTVWLSCSGESVGDKENLPEGHITYEPERKIPGYYFPYKNQKNYRSPFVMVNFDIPKTSRHLLINIECRAWAKNIKYDRVFRLGSVHFELMVD
jgi:sodium/potassium-transporting ATPase subunit beta